MDSFLSESLFSDSIITELLNQHWSSVAQFSTIQHSYLPNAVEWPLLLPTPW